MTRKEKRGQMGYGSSYRKGRMGDIGNDREIGSVLGGQVWMVKPDQKAPVHNSCLWMTAGVIKYKDCHNFFDCTTCKFDQGMRLQVEKGKQISWQDAMRRKSDMERVCRHSLTGRMDSRICAYDYRCAKCDFDQYFEDYLTPKTMSQPDATHRVKGFDLPTDRYFHSGHTWARIESGGTIRVGMDDFALKLLGKADALELPLTGYQVEMGRAGWGLKRKNHQAEVLSPVDGVVMEVNRHVGQNPQLANREPYRDGWLFVAHCQDVKASMKKLMAGKASLNWISEEILTLETMIEDVAGPLAADGGFIGEDIYGNLPALGWDNLIGTFLKTGQ